MRIPRVKPLVSRNGIQREITKARKELLRSKRHKKMQEDAVVRQLLQLEALERILWDYHFIP